jgi:hypothetical protein
MATAEQRQAQAEFDEAVLKFANAMGWAGERRLVSQWCMVIALACFEEDGATYSEYCQAFRSGESSEHEAIGLFRLGAAQIEHNYLEAARNNGDEA